ncbi:MAG: MBL fold metallo-hydrolase [Gammaproteobacteria bacterium]|jgi:7,8-dihydropterin-6-yl-methyl-4-(beta-D-ribofuranosyl)aminobenzene 5'-phosphate synthase
MSIKLLFDTSTINNKFKTGWGFSCLVNKHILFDTGNNGNVLLHNLNLMDINLSDINGIVISHEHQDHSGGLWKILEYRHNIPVYICPGFNQTFKDKIKNLHSIPVISQPFQEITRKIFTTGELSGIYKNYKIPEQSLVIKSSKGLVIITGCAHSGIINIIKTVKNHFPKNNIYLVLGGFHLTGTSKTKIEEIVKNFKKLKVQKVAPLHCSGNPAKKIFKQYYGNDFTQLHVGETFFI